MLDFVIESAEFDCFQLILSMDGLRGSLNSTRQPHKKTSLQMVAKITTSKSSGLAYELSANKAIKESLLPPLCSCC